MDEVIAMKTREIDRLRAIRDVLDGKLTQSEAAKIIRRSVRQVRRLCARVSKEGNRGLVHRLRGRPSNHRLDDEILEYALGALHDPLWEGFGPTFAQEKLQSRHGITLSVGLVRKLMMRTEIWRRAHRGHRHRIWRPRRLCLGMLTQLDGSEHDWFEGRGPRCTLLIYIDDATSQILYGEFVDSEATLTLLRTTKIYLQRRGRPLAFYVDKDSIYKVSRQPSVDEELRDEYPMTQYTRAMSELGVEVICANSPQAKGRVERGFGTHQDRLVKEMRLRAISTMQAANRFLWDDYIPEHNRRFAVAPTDSSDQHRPLLASHHLDQILSLRSERIVGSDYTVRFNNSYFQILADQPFRIRPKDKLLVEQRLDGSTHLRFKDCYLNFKSIAKPIRLPQAAFKPELWVRRPRKHRKPSQTHPWRQGYQSLSTPMTAHIATHA